MSEGPQGGHGLFGWVRQGVVLQIIQPLQGRWVHGRWELGGGWRTRLARSWQTRFAGALWRAAGRQLACRRQESCASWRAGEAGQGGARTSSRRCSARRASRAAECRLLRWSGRGSSTKGSRAPWRMPRMCPSGSEARAMTGAGALPPSAVVGTLFARRLPSSSACCAVSMAQELAWADKKSADASHKGEAPLTGCAPLVGFGSAPCGRQQPVVTRR